MNILFVGKRSAQESVGVEKKLDNQIHAFQSLGHTVWYTCAGPDGCFLYGPDPGDKVKLCEYKSYFPAALNEANNNAQMLLAAVEHPDTTFDLCYIRKPLCDKKHLRALAKLRRRGTVIVEEIPTYPYDGELQRQSGIGPKVYLAIDRHYRKKLGQYVDFIATYSVDRAIFGAPAILVENAVRVEDIPISHAAPATDGTLRLIAVSSMYFWHGYDRLIAGLGAYKAAGKMARQNVLLHLVGDGPEREAWQTLAREMGVTENVLFHGMQSGPALDALFDESDVAVSSLGWYRKGMGDTPTFEIKTREYISRGKPLAFACVDPRALAVQPYSLQLPNNDSHVDIGALAAFWQPLAEQSYAQALREYALANLQWKTQMENVLQACELLLKKGAKRP